MQTEYINQSKAEMRHTHNNRQYRRGLLFKQRTQCTANQTTVANE